MRELQPCGTTAAYMRHVRAKEPACQLCLDAVAAAGRKRRGFQPYHPVECGTNSGYVRHWQRKQAPCEPCREAHRQYNRELYARTKARKEGTA